ncbi:glycoside hydrolase family 127 protein [Halosquirtibacter xylanolyticus]|uniref:beta-L-arabinofuranosidase domain-containing protein n=1 Tax=Halosquirtibacter xylanolyticus TaxID=3374599 RepID=UPI003748C3B8|nr:glycoside hydrolase family 127 protein [Prolixibacteraceae bacterium]
MMRIFILFLLFQFTVLYGWSKKKNYLELSPLTIGTITPRSWLNKEAEFAITGIPGNLDLSTIKPFSLHPFLMENHKSGAFGYEQMGYYLDGVTRLAYITNNQKLKKKVSRYYNACLKRQDNDGFFISGMKSDKNSWATVENGTKDEVLWNKKIDAFLWGMAAFSRGALAYYDGTKDDRILDMLQENYKSFQIWKRDDNHMPMSGMEMHWNRRLVNLEVMISLYLITKEKSLKQKIISILKANESGMLKSWGSRNTSIDDFQHWSYTDLCHGVTYNEMAKLYGVGYAVSGNKQYLRASVNAFEHLEKYHVLPNGVNSSNEYLRGIGGFEASETCNVSDYMWSNLWLLKLTGDVKYADRIEKVFFNAGHQAISHDYSKHVYVQTPNRIKGVHIEHRDKGTEFKAFHKPVCCTANLCRILPNYIMHMAMRTKSGSLALLLYGPCKINSPNISMDIKSNYPMTENINIHINEVAKRSQTIYFRIPSWCKSPNIEVNGRQVKVVQKVSGYISIKRNWMKGDDVDLHLPMDVVVNRSEEKIMNIDGKELYIAPKSIGSNKKLSSFDHGASYATVTRGPLLFALPLKDSTNYNMSLVVPNKLSAIVNENCCGVSWDKPMVSIKALFQISDWNLDEFHPKLPAMPIDYDKSRVFEYELIPYGSATFRISMIPYVNKKN